MRPDEGGNAMENQNVWSNPFLKFLRWLAFIPIGMILANILLAIPVKLFHLCFPLRVDPPIVRYIVAFILVPVSFGALYWWGIGCFMTSVLACRFIAPNRRIASVLYTIVIVVTGLATILFSYFLVATDANGNMVDVPGPSLWFIAYYCVFLLLCAIGSVYSGLNSDLQTNAE